MTCPVCKDRDAHECYVLRYPGTEEIRPEDPDWDSCQCPCHDEYEEEEN